MATPDPSPMFGIRVPSYLACLIKSGLVILGVFALVCFAIGLLIIFGTVFAAIAGPEVWMFDTPGINATWGGIGMLIVCGIFGAASVFIFVLLIILLTCISMSIRESCSRVCCSTCCSSYATECSSCIADCNEYEEI